MTKRREFLKLAGLAVAVPGLRTGADYKHNRPATTPTPFQLGMASYTFREFGLEDTLAMTVRLGLKRIAFKSFHLPLESSPEDIKTALSLVKAAGLILYGGGVIYMETEEQVHQAFAYAEAAGMEVVIGVPEHSLLPLVEKKVISSGISLAIHNHGPTDSRYPTPESAYKLIRDMHPGMGICLDAGHTQRAGVDPADSVRRCADRLLDIHIKDVSAASADGHTVEIGRGVIDIPRFLRTLSQVNYTGCVSLEYEKDGKDPLPGAAESVGYVRGVLSLL
jgi:inosose dehydratase